MVTSFRFRSYLTFR